MRKLFHAKVVAVLSAAAVSVGALVTHSPSVGADPYTPVQTQDNAEFAIADGYIVKQMNYSRRRPCTRRPIRGQVVRRLLGCGVPVLLKRTGQPPTGGERAMRL